MFTTIGYSESRAGTAGYTPNAGALDNHVRVYGDVIYVPELEYIVGKIDIGGTIGTAGYIQSPSLRRTALIDITNIVTAVNPAGEVPDPFHPLNPIKVEENEGLEALLEESTTTTEVRTVGVFLSDGSLQPVTGEIFSVLATSNPTSVTGTWVNGALDFRQTLPVGNYQVVGARCFGATLCLFRLNFIGYPWRPGGVGITTYDTLDPFYQRFGRLGVWGEFHSTTPPSVEVLAGTAAAQGIHIILDVIYLG